MSQKKKFIKVYFRGDLPTPPFFLLLTLVDHTQKREGKKAMQGFRLWCLPFVHDRPS